jgi:type II secretory pathway component PulM
MSFAAVMLGVLGALLMMAIYWIGLQVRIFGKWAQREPGPRERRGVFATAAAIFGFIAGIMLYQPVLEGLRCHDAGQPVGKCMIATAFNKQ